METHPPMGHRIPMVRQIRMETRTHMEHKIPMDRPLPHTVHHRHMEPQAETIPMDSKTRMETPIRTEAPRLTARNPDMTRTIHMELGV